MTYYEVAPTKVFRANASVLTYSFEHQLPLGTIVEIELGKHNIIGIVVREVEQPKFKTKPIFRTISTTPLPSHLLRAAVFLSDYYATATPIVWQTILPSGLEKTK